jgi:hypothetical protein
MPTNTSATGGYLTPTNTQTDDQALQRFIHAVLCGLTGLEAALVRPLWQANPAPTPDISVDWLAYGIASRRADNDSFLKMNTAGTQTTQQRHEELEYRLMFYGPNCLGNASELRDAILIHQNQDVLYQSGMAIVNASDITHAPELVNERHFNRCDIVLTVRRELNRVYSIFNFTAAGGTIKANRTESTLIRGWETS